MITAAVVLWAVSNLVPLEDTPFEDHIIKRVSPDQDTFFAEFLAHLKEAHIEGYVDGEKGEEDEEKEAIKDTHVEGSKYPNLYMALSNVATLEGHDLTTYFPDIKPGTNNRRKRNEIVARVLLYESKGKLKLGLDMRGGVAMTLEIPEEKWIGIPDTERAAVINTVVEVMIERLNKRGVSEPLIRAHGERSVEIQLPGPIDQVTLEFIKRPAVLEFRRAYVNIPSDALPSAFEELIMEDENAVTGDINLRRFFVKILPDATGEIVESSRRQLNDFGKWIPSMDFTAEGSEKFATLTRGIVEENRLRGIGPNNTGPDEAFLGIVLDGKLCSAPSVKEEIRGGGAIINGVFTEDEVLD